LPLPFSVKVTDISPLSDYMVSVFRVMFFFFLLKGVTHWL